VLCSAATDTPRTSISFLGRGDAGEVAAEPAWEARESFFAGVPGDGCGRVRGRGRRAFRAA